MMTSYVADWPAIRQRAARHGLLARLTADFAPELAAELQIPATGIASWNLYYYCPEHAVRLIWDRASPHQHRCPVDNHLFSGEPYDSAWWREMNGRNAAACTRAGLLWQLTGDPCYARHARQILARYADYYPDYAIHGGIPHNGPGKMNAQTLCEANCLLELAQGYHAIAGTLTPEEKAHIRSRLLRPAASFLQAHRSPQIHNHEVKINAAIAVLGFVLQDEALLEFAVTGEHGLLWQLENGLLEEGLWFEGSVHYHYYALQGFLAFEKFAQGTRWSLLTLPYYRKMLSFPLQLLMPDGCFPRLNDCIAGQETLHHRDVYEFAWFIWQDPLYAAVLHYLDQREPEYTVDTALWRDRPLPDSLPPLIPESGLFAPGAGLTVWRKPAQGQALLIKHSPYGGEHDHYDRLNIMLWHHGTPLLPDLGTTGYGARMHYDYYKNSATHNTLTVNQSNQPPATPHVLSWHQGEKGFWLDSLVDWRNAPPTLNSHTRVEWDDEAWRDIRFRRRLLWLDDLLIDLSDVDNPWQAQLDWTLHLQGTALDQAGEPACFAASGPLAIMQNATQEPLTGCQPRHFRHQHGTVALWLAGDAALWQGLAPDNPAISPLSYLVLRSQQPQARFFCLWDFNEQHPLTDVELRHDSQGTHLRLWRQGQVFSLTVPGTIGEIPAMLL